MTNLLDSQIEEELLASKRTLERNLSTVIDSLSIPRGFCNDKIIRMAQSIGYKHVFISERLNNLKTLCYDRIAIKNDWTLEKFERALIGRKTIFEKVSDGLKRTAKLILRESGYNFMRSFFIKLIK